MKAQEHFISTRQYKAVASTEAAIFNYQCDQIQYCEDGCETKYTKQKCEKPNIKEFDFKLQRQKAAGRG